MTDSDNRRRDDAARTRDEMARGRDDLARDRDEFAQRATSAARTVQTWATLVVIVMVAGLFWLISQEKEAIETMRESAIRTEEAAVRTEDALRDILAQEQTPESQAFSAAVRRALGDIADVREILCAGDDPPEACEEP
jgi:hypothetical protein